jgi:phosphopantetheinyl transferase
MKTGDTDFENTEYIIRDSLDSFRSSFSFEFYIVNMRDIERRLDQKDSGLLSALSERELEHLEKLRLKKNKVQWAAGRYAVKSALFKYNLADSCFVDVMKQNDASPYILQYPELCVSITHSYPFCIGLVAEGRAGVDLERITKQRASLIKHFYSRAERAALDSFKDMEEYDEKAVLYWTRKEAASKLLRLGMNLDFRSIDATDSFIKVNDIDIRFESAICGEFCVSVAFEEIRADCR